MGVCERVGSGLYNIFDVWEKSGLAKPIIEEKFNPDRIVLTLVTAYEVVNDEINDEINDGIKLSKTEEVIYSIISENGNLTIPEISGTIGKSETTVGRAIQKLKEENIIARVGSKKDGHWRIKK